MAESSFSKAASTAAGYYNSNDADRFYAEVWGCLLYTSDAADE